MTPIFECIPPFLVVTIHLLRRHHQRLSLDIALIAFASIRIAFFALNFELSPGRGEYHLNSSEIDLKQICLGGS